MTQLQKTRVPAFVVVGLLLLLAAAPQRSAAQRLRHAPAATAYSIPTASVTSPDGPGINASGDVPSTDNIRVGVGDVLDILVFDTPELSGKARVNEAGNITLPLVGAVHVDGLFPQEVQSLLANRLVEGHFVKAPQVIVGVAEFGVQGITVTGEVKKPGLFPPTGSRRLQDLLARAEGLTPLASKTVYVFHRNSPGEPLKLKLTDDPVEARAANPELQFGDTVVVPKAGVVYVIGDVAKPGGFVMEADRLSVMQVLALAAGPNRTAKLDQAKIIRKTSTGVDEVPLQLAKIMNSKAQDVPVQAGDIVYVPSSMAKTAAKSSAQAILQSAFGAIIYTTLR